MKKLTRLNFSTVAILVLALTTYIPVQAQKQIEDCFASINGLVDSDVEGSSSKARVTG
jgi:hypothetical protein